MCVCVYLYICICPQLRKKETSIYLPVDVDRMFAIKMYKGWTIFLRWKMIFQNRAARSRRTGFEIFFLHVRSCTVRAQSRLYKGWTISLKTTSLEIELNIPRIRRTDLTYFSYAYMPAAARSELFQYTDGRTFGRDLDSKYFKKLFRFGLKVDTLRYDNSFSR